MKVQSVLTYSLYEAILGISVNVESEKKCGYDTNMEKKRTICLCVVSAFSIREMTLSAREASLNERK